MEYVKTASEKTEFKFVNEFGFCTDMSEASIRKQITVLLDCWKDFLRNQQEEGLKCNKDYFIHSLNLFEVVNRLHQRETYYYVFHQINQICEYKSVAIICYWINTLKPFMVVKQDSKLYNCPNEMFSLYLIISTIRAVYRTKFPNDKFPKLDEESIKDYIYNFKYCGLSREATIFFVETLAKSYGVGMYESTASDRYSTEKHTTYKRQY